MIMKDRNVQYRAFLHGSLVISCHFYVSLQGHYTLREDNTFVISREDLMLAYQSNNYWPIWTFNTSEGYRIRFNFTEFSFYWNTNDYNLLDIGDGLNQNAETRLATFGGRDLPSNVTSVSNAAWLKVNDPYAIHNSCHIKDVLVKTSLDKWKHLCLSY